VIALAAAFAAGYAVHSSSSSSSTSYAQPRATRAANATFNAPRETHGIAAGFGSLWVLAGAEHAVVDHFDAASDLQHGAPISVLAYARNIVAGPSGVWISSMPNIQRIDPSSESTEHPVDAHINIDGGLALGAGLVWDLDFGATTGTNIGNGTSSVTMVDERSGSIVGKTGSLPACPGTLTPGEDAVYIFYDQCSGAQSIVRVQHDGSSNSHSLNIGSAPSAALSDGSLWVINAEDGTVTPLSPTSLLPVGSPIYLGNYPSSVAADRGYLWVTLTGDSQVAQFDPRRRIVAGRWAVGANPVQVAAENGHVWTYNSAQGGTISRIDLQSPAASGDTRTPSTTTQKLTDSSTCGDWETAGTTADQTYANSVSNKIPIPSQYSNTPSAEHAYAYGYIGGRCDRLRKAGRANDTTLAVALQL
jgi:hypothetical protein